MSAIGGVSRAVALVLLAAGVLPPASLGASGAAVDPRWSQAMAALDRPEPAARRDAARTLNRLAVDPGRHVEGRSGVNVAAVPPADFETLAAHASLRGEDRAVRLPLIAIFRTDPRVPALRVATGPLVDILMDESDDTAVRSEAAGVLVFLAPDPRVLPALEAACRSRDPELRQVALRAVGELTPEPRTILPLVEQGLIDPSRPVRAAAIDVASALADRGAPDAMRILARLATQREDRESRLRALRALASVESAVAADVAAVLTLSLAAEPDPLVRVLLASALLGATHDAGTYVPLLVEGLHSSTTDVWREAAQALMIMPRGARKLIAVQALKDDLNDPDLDRRTRSAVVLSLITRQPEAYRRWIEPGLRSRDAETRRFARIGLASARWQSSWPARLRPSREMWNRIALGAVGLVAFVWWEMRRFARKQPGRGKQVLILTTSDQVRLVPVDAVAWNDEPAVARIVAALQSLGFEDAGRFVAAGDMSNRVWALVKPEAAIVARIHDHPYWGLHLDLGTEFQDGTGYTLTTRSGPFRPEMPPAWQLIIVEGPLDVALLYNRLLAERPEAPLRPIAAEAFPAYYEQLLADYADWRNSRGGMSENEIRAMNRARGVEIDDRTLALVRQQLQIRALNALDASLRTRFLDAANLAGEERERYAARLVIVHDGLPLVSLSDAPNFEGAEWPARRRFDASNQQRAAPERYLLIGTIHRPVPADVYLSPESPS